MIGAWQSYSNIYLVFTGVVMLITFGIPLVIVPLRWARAFRWEIPDPLNLVIFLSRSLGILISVLAVFAFLAAGEPAAKPFYFDLMLSVIAAMLILHVYGALKKTLPITETAEIVLWVLLFLLTLCFYPIGST
jgi:hypothetical protein